MGTPVRDHVQRETVELEDMLHQQLGRLLGRRQLLERNEVCHLAEMVSDDEDDRISTGTGQTYDEIQRNMCPGCPTTATQTLSSGSQVRVAMIHNGGRMVSGPLVGSSPFANCRDRASSFTFLELGR